MTILSQIHVCQNQNNIQHIHHIKNEAFHPFRNHLECAHEMQKNIWHTTMTTYDHVKWRTFIDIRQLAK